MPDARSTRADLVFDLALALSQTPLKRKGVSLDELRAHAARIVEQLELCRWQFHRPPPGELHGPTKRDGSADQGR